MKLVLVAMILAAGALAPGSAHAQTAPDPVRIGMVQTLFTDVPTPIVNLLTPPFKSLMKEFTGLNGAPNAGGDAFEIARKLTTGELHLGVLHGVEYAWVSQKHPEIKPLMIAVNKYPTLKAHLVVRKDDKISAFSDLKGTDFAYPFRAREHLRLFVERHSGDPKSFFGAVTKATSAEAALDDVLNGKLDATVVDTLAWENYAEVKPGCYKRLRVLHESEAFPAAVVVYRQGTLNDATLNKFRQGMMSANKSDRGRDLMTLWKLSGFESVPATYQESCESIARSYPAPVAATVVSQPKD